LSLLANAAESAYKSKKVLSINVVYRRVAPTPLSFPCETESLFLPFCRIVFLRLHLFLSSGMNTNAQIRHPYQSRIKTKVVNKFPVPHNSKHEGTSGLNQCHGPVSTHYNSIHLNRGSQCASRRRVLLLYVV